MFRKLKPMTALTAFVAAAAVLTSVSFVTAGEGYDKKKNDSESKSILETAKAAGTFNTLAAAIEAAGLTEALSGDGPFTVFAPTDDAFAKLPEGTVATLLKPENKAKLAAILTYHVAAGKTKAAQVVKMSAVETLNGQRLDVKVQGEVVTIDGATITATDIKASNGIIHVIDTVVLPSFDDAVDTAAKAGTFNTLIAAAKAAGLAEVLKAEGPYTIFAPTDDAFAKLPKGTVESLLKPENKAQLAAILKHHVVAGRVFSDAVKDDAKVTTLNGTSLTASVSDGKVKLDNATVTAADVDASNAVIHVIDTVLIPAADKQAASH